MGVPEALAVFGKPGTAFVDARKRSLITCSFAFGSTFKINRVQRASKKGEVFYEIFNNNNHIILLIIKFKF